MTGFMDCCPDFFGFRVKSVPDNGYIGYLIAHPGMVEWGGWC